MRRYGDKRVSVDMEHVLLCKCRVTVVTERVEVSAIGTPGHMVAIWSA